MDRPLNEDDDDTVGDPPTTSNRGDVNTDEQGVTHEGNDNSNADTEMQFGSLLFRTVRSPQIGGSSLSTGGNEDAPCFSYINSRGETTYVTIVRDSQSNNSSEIIVFDLHDFRPPSRIYAQNPMPWDPNPYRDGHPFSPEFVEGALSSTWNMVQSYRNDRPSHMYDSRMVDIRILLPQTPGLHNTSASTREGIMRSFREREISEVSILKGALPYFHYGALTPLTGGNIARLSNLGAGSSSFPNLDRSRYFPVLYMRSPHTAASESRFAQNAEGSSTPWSYSYSEHGLAMTPSYWCEVPNIRRRGSSSNPPPSDEPICHLCGMELRSVPPGAESGYPHPPDTAILPCGHSFHEHCLSTVRPPVLQFKDPPCIRCAGADH